MSNLIKGLSGKTHKKITQAAKVGAVILPKLQFSLLLSSYSLRKHK